MSAVSSRKVVTIALIVSVAIIVAVLSIPEIIEPLAENMIEEFGGSLPLIFSALFLIGMIHGLKPDQHTWPITIPYAISQRSLFMGILASFVFTGTLTLVWTMLSTFTGVVLNLVTDPEALTPYADALAGTTMITVASIFLFRTKKNGMLNRIDEPKTAPNFKYIWIHGLAASFGGDFLVVLLLATLLVGSIIPVYLSFTIGLLFGIGSMLTQAIVVIAAYKGAKTIIKNAYMMAQSGVLSLLFLGVFLIVLGLLGFFIHLH